MKRIAVLGSGLLGGSIALAVQAYLPNTQVCLWGRRDEAVTEAQDLGVTEATTDMKQAVTGADLIILSSPVGAMPQILKAAGDVAGLSGVVITDVGSVKVTPLNDLDCIARDLGAYYIGSHPMAGSEQAGVSAAQSDLFQNAACIITNDSQHADDKVANLSSFWESIGCNCHITSAVEHDQIMARVSHLPHMLASVGALVALKHPEYADFSGNGLRDTTRVASGHPAMWAEIMLNNRDALKQPIEEAINHLREMLALLENTSEEELTSILDDAKQRRDNVS